jgi:signal peptidase II
MNWKKIAILTIVLIIIDQITKLLIYNLWFLNSNYFITPILNKWISFWITFFHFNLLIILIPLILAAIWYLYKNQQINPLAFALIFAGWLSNFIDRIIFFWVRDFINLHFFPIFNLADIFISLGFIIIFFNLIQPQEKI